MVQRSGRRRSGGWRRWAGRLAWGLPLLALLASVLPVLLLRWVDPPTSAFMLARQFEARSGGQPGFVLRHRWVDWDALSPQLPIALVAAEDQRFPEHAGFDFAAIDQALADNARGGRMRGASTISQQVAKNLFLWEQRSWLRKAVEAWFTVLIETLWPKQRILEVYANLAEFGNGVFGAEAAARHFFGKPAAELDATESARLAAVLPSPRRYSVSAPGPFVQQRTAWIREQVLQLGGPAYLAECCGVPGSPPAKD